MDKSEECSDEAVERFIAKQCTLMGKLLSFQDGMRELAEFMQGEVRRAYQAGQVDRDRKESKDESGGIS